MSVNAERATDKSTGKHGVKIRFSAATGIRLAFAVTGTFVLVSVIGQVSGALLTVAMSVTLALALDPVSRAMERRFRLPRGAALALIGTLAILFVGFIVAFIGPRALDEAQKTTNEFPETLEALTSMPVVGDIVEHLEVQSKIDDWMNHLPEALRAEKLIPMLEKVVNGLTSGLLIVVIGITILIDGPRLVTRLSALIPDRFSEESIAAGRILYKTIGAYFAGSLLVATLASSYVFLLCVIFNIPLAPLVALWVLLANFVPQIGGFLSAVMIAVMGLGASPGAAVGALLAYWIYMTIENHVVQPVVVGGALNLSVAATMLAVLLGGTLLGIPGAILGAPVVATIKSLYSQLVLKKAQEFQTVSVSEKLKDLFSKVKSWFSK